VTHYDRPVIELVQIILPVYGNDGEKLPRDLYRQTFRELTERFGGMTAFTRAPAEGLWEDDSGRVVRDDVIVVEVMNENLEDLWWADYKRTLEARFAQDTILIRQLPCRVV
jgi:hypothetical protein